MTMHAFCSALGGIALSLISQAGASQVLTEYPIATPNAGLKRICAGPDGALWFTESFANNIGRISIDGAVSEYPTPVNSFPSGITPGPDGAVWFGQLAGNIGRITPAGSLTQFSGGGSVEGIAEGPDGALWFAQPDDNNIGRITTTGVVTLYPVITPSSVPNAITAGADGALWFTESVNGSHIGRITTSGVVTEYLVPTDTFIIDITVGPVSLRVSKL